MMKLVTGRVDTDEEYIELVYGRTNRVDPKDSTAVALVAPGPGNDFTGEYTLVANESKTGRVIREVQRQLEYFLIEKRRARSLGPCEVPLWHRV